MADTTPVSTLRELPYQFHSDTYEDTAPSGRTYKTDDLHFVKPQMQPIDIVEDSIDSWDNQAEDDEVEPRQMGGGVMNSDYESEKLHILDESSSSSEHCEVSSDGETPTVEVDNSIRRSRYPIFRLVAKAKNLRFEKDMLFLSPK